MTKVHPNATVNAVATSSAAVSGKLRPALASDGGSVVLTVWKKSLLFNWDGFTVFDDRGNLVFRVDNYSYGKSEILLMDASGNALLTIRRKRLILGDSWAAFDGETTVNPLFSVRKQVKLVNTKSLARVHVGSAGNGTGAHKSVVYEIEGSYAQRCCAVYDGKRRRVAEISRKESVRGAAFGTDVFRLVVQSEMDSAVAMALVILLDLMLGSSKRFSI